MKRLSCTKNGSPETDKANYIYLKRLVNLQSCENNDDPTPNKEKKE